MSFFNIETPAWMEQTSVLAGGGWESRTWSPPLADRAYRNEVWGRLMLNRRITTSGCWEWTKYRNPDGYGVISVKGRMTSAHQVASAIAAGGLWSPSLELDHLCRNRSCFYPAHLEPVTDSENTIRGLAPLVAALRAQLKTHCKSGHEFSPENTYVHPRTGHRACRRCRADCERRRTKAKAA